MSQEEVNPKRRHVSRIRIVEDITDPVELDRLSKLTVHDGGAALIAGEAESYKRNNRRGSYIAMIRGIAELLSPEEQLELADALPKMLSPEARAKLAAAASA